jgi:rhamnosyltransferase
MIYAGKLLKSGKALRYCASAVVYHSIPTRLRSSSEETLIWRFRRRTSGNFCGIKSESEGKKLVQDDGGMAEETGRGTGNPGLYWISGCKYLGYWLGKTLQETSRLAVKKLSMNKAYWEKKNEGHTGHHTGFNEEKNIAGVLNG